MRILKYAQKTDIRIYIKLVVKLSFYKILYSFIQAVIYSQK